MAWYLRSRPCLAEPPGRFALNHENFAPCRIALLAIGELPGQPTGIERGLAAREFACFARRFAGAGGVNTLADDSPRHGGVLIEVSAKLLVDELLDLALDVAIQLAFRLTFELRLRQLHRDHRDQPLAHVISSDGNFVLLLLEHAALRRKIINRARQCRAKPGKVRAAIHRINRVREGKNIFRVAVVILQRDFHFHLVALAFDIDRRIVQHLLAAVEVLDEFRDTSGKAELRGFVAALIGKRDLQTLIEERELAQPLRQQVVAIDCGTEDLRVGVKRDLRARLARLPRLFQLVDGLSALIRLLPHGAIPADFHIQRIGQRIHHGNADAVQPARNFVGLRIEFAASVQYRQHHFRGGTLLCGVHIHRNSASVVLHSDAIVFVDRDVDLVAVARHRFVHRVVHYFPYEVVQTHLTRRADVHGGTQAHGFQSAEHLDRGSIVAMTRSFSGACFFICHRFSR